MERERERERESEREREIGKPYECNFSSPSLSVCLSPSLSLSLSFSLSIPTSLFRDLCRCLSRLNLLCIIRVRDHHRHEVFRFFLFSYRPSRHIDTAESSVRANDLNGCLDGRGAATGEEGRRGEREREGGRRRGGEREGERRRGGEEEREREGELVTR